MCSERLWISKTAMHEYWCDLEKKIGLMKYELSGRIIRVCRVEAKGVPLSER